jgi:NADPH:quinone reductase-like Zn-dependent oxidoreductase
VKAIRVHAYGGLEEMKLEELLTPEPPSKHAPVQVKAAEHQIESSAARRAERKC